MCATAYCEGFSNFLYFDQDTIFTEATLEYINCFATLWLNQKNNIGDECACITFRDFSRSIRQGGKLRYEVGNYSITRVDFTISSGSLFNLERLKAAGWHDDTFFIDGVDYAVCLAIAKSGCLIGEIGPTPGLDHRTEQEDGDYKILGYRFRGRRYPVYRLKDFVLSSLRLILIAARQSMKKTIWLLRSLTLFCIMQILVRIMREQP
jgi:rhamnosyltransferase